MTVKICPSCGHKHDSNDTFCPYCKYSYNYNKVVCKNCGAYLKPTDKVCYVCDELVEKTEEANFEEENNREVLEAKEEKPVKSKKGIVVAICVVVVLIVAAIGICFKFDVFGNNNQQETSAFPTESQQVTEPPTEEITESVTQEVTETQFTDGVKLPTELKRSYYTYTLPQEWNDNYTIVENDECIQIFEKYNYENYSCGHLLSIYAVESWDTSYDDLHSVKTFTSTDGKVKVFVVTPQDVQCSLDDEHAMIIYSNISALTDKVIDSIKVK